MRSRPAGPGRCYADARRVEPHDHQARAAGRRQSESGSRTRTSARSSRSIEPTAPRGDRPTAWQGEVSQVADKYGEASLEARLMKAIASSSTRPPFRLRRRTSPSSSIRTSPRRASAATLLPRSSSWSATTGFARDGRLQSPEQKDWEKNASRHRPPAGRRDSPRRAALKERLAGLRHGRARVQGRGPRRGREGGRGRHSAPYR